MTIEKRVVMPYGQNTSYTIFRLLEGAERLTLKIVFRHHEGLGQLADEPQCAVRVTAASSS